MKMQLPKYWKCSLNAFINITFWGENKCPRNIKRGNSTNCRNIMASRYLAHINYNLIESNFQIIKKKKEKKFGFFTCHLIDNELFRQFILPKDEAEQVISFSFSSICQILVAHGDFCVQNFTRSCRGFYMEKVLCIHVLQVSKYPSFIRKYQRIW